jgi:hypothetical protein
MRVELKVEFLVRIRGREMNEEEGRNFSIVYTE